MITVEGVPESVPRAAIVPLVEALGLDPNRVIRLEFGTRAISAEVYAVTSDGARYSSDAHGEPFRPATHRLSIRIED